MTYVKGQKSANPKGRPIGSLSLVDILRRKLSANYNGLPDSVAEKLVEDYIKDAFAKSEMKKDVFDRIDGKPKQDVGVGGLDGGAIEIKIKMV